MSDLGVVPTSSVFAAASREVVTYLQEAIPLGSWLVTRYDGEYQVYLTVDDRGYGTLAAGDSLPWSDTLCQHAVSGAAPQIAPDAMSVPLYAGTTAAQNLPIRTFIGIPIRTSGGKVFGTLCGVDPSTSTPALVQHAPLLNLLSSMLSRVLEADMESTAAARAVELAELVAETDALTGLTNRRGWDRFVALEDERFRRYGDPCAVITLDLDGLKDVNDSLGHDAGDDYIRQAARVLRATCRETDVVARLGGDEFGIILTQTPRSEAIALLDRLERALEAAGVPASFGLAPYSLTAGVAGAWKASDQAMYAAKMRRRHVHVRVDEAS